MSVLALVFMPCVASISVQVRALPDHTLRARTWRARWPHPTDCGPSLETIALSRRLPLSPACSECAGRFRNRSPWSFDGLQGSPPVLCLAVDLDDFSGHLLAVRRLDLRGDV